MKPGFQSSSSLRYAGMFLLLFLLLILSFPGNRSENDDGYFYAYAIRTYDYAQLWLPRYLIFLPFFKALLNIVQWINPQADAYQLMCVCSSVASIASVLLLYRLLRQHFNTSHIVAFCSAAFLLLSYGYWRYAVEAEVYGIALLLCLLSVYAACASITNAQQGKYLALTALLCGVTVMWYKPAGAVTCIAIPLYMILERTSVLKICSWAAMVVLLVVSGYAMAFYASEVDTTFWTYCNSGIQMAGGHPLNAVPVVASNVVSLNFIYAFPAVVSLIEQWFPGKLLVEEVFAAQHHTSLAILAVCTSLLFLILALFALWKIRRSISLEGFWKNPFVLWLVVYSAALLIVDPGSPEPWLMIQPALFAVLGIYFFPLIVLHTSKRLLYVLVFVLCLHNIVGGYLFIQKEDEDYTRFQSAWLIKNATANDMVISLGSASAVRYLLYYGEAKVFTGEQQFQQAMLAAKQVHQHGGKIYLTDDFVHPSLTVQRRNAAAFAQVQSMLQQQQANIHLLHQQDNTAAAVYQWTPQ